MIGSQPAGDEMGERLPHRERVQGVALATIDGRNITVSADVAGQIAVWDLASRRLMLKIELDKLVRALALCGRRIVVGTDAGLIAIDVGDLPVFLTFAHHDEPRSMPVPARPA
jgi:hypothetical protein